LENMATVTVFVKSQGKYHARPGFQDQEHENLNHGKRRKAEIKITPMLRELYLYKIHPNSLSEDFKCL